MTWINRGRGLGGNRYALIAVALLGLAFAAALSIGSRGDAGTAAAASNKPLTISVVMGFGGPYGKVINNAYQGFQTAVADANKAGGVNGHKIKVIKVDHHETTAGGVAACKQVQSNGSFVAAVLQGSGGANTSATKCLDRAGIPTLYFASVKDPSLKRAFTYLASASDQGASLATFIKTGLKRGTSKIGVIFDTAEAYTQQKNGFAAAVKRQRLKVLAYEGVTATQSSFVPVLTKMKQKGVQTLAFFGTAEGPGIWRDAATIGFRPHFTGSGFLFNFVSTAAKQSAKNVTGVGTNATVETGAFANYAKRMAANGIKVNRATDNGFVLYGAGQLMLRMLKNAGKSPTAKSFVAGAEKIKGYNNGILSPITYSKRSHFGSSASFPAVCCNGDFTWKRYGAANVLY